MMTITFSLETNKGKHWIKLFFKRWSGWVLVKITHKRKISQSLRWMYETMVENDSYLAHNQNQSRIDSCWKPEIQPLWKIILYVVYLNGCEFQVKGNQIVHVTTTFWKYMMKTNARLHAYHEIHMAAWCITDHTFIHNQKMKTISSVNIW
jgi:hypothetical protein